MMPISKLSYKTLFIFTSIVLAGLLVIAAVPRNTNTFDEITVRRINVVEPDGTLRMVISDHAKLPGIIVKGKEQPFERPQAGLIFYNDEGSENGGLIFGGRKNKEGKVVDSGGSLTFDKYGANQIIQLLGVEDSEDRFAGLSVTDSITGTENYRRVWVGRGDDGTATIALMDGKGRKRILLEVGENGRSSLSFLDDKGNVLEKLEPHKK